MAGEWPRVQISEVCELIVDCVNKTAPKVDGPTPFKMLRTTNVRNGRINTTDCKYVTEEVFEKWTRRARVLRGDVILTREAPMGEVGRVSVDDTIFLGQRLMQYRANPKLLDSRFLLYAFRSADLRHQFFVHEGSGSVVSHIRVPDCSKFIIPLPPMEEQLSIAEILGTLDDKIELNRQTNETLEAIAQALFKSWFVDFDPVIDNALAAGNDIPEPFKARAAARQALGDARKPLPEEIRREFPDGFEFRDEIGWIPRGWAVNPFGELLELSIGGDWGKDTPDEKHTESVVVIRGTDFPALKTGERSAAPIRFVEHKKLISRKLVEGDILIEISGGSPKQPTGRSLYITKDVLDRLNGSVVAASFCRRFKPKGKDIGLFAALHLDRIYAEGKTWEYQNQSTGISNFQTKSFLEREFVALPVENDLLAHFGSYVVAITNRKQLNVQISLAALRDILLPKLMSGQLTIPEAEKLVSDAT